jgi:hypothetical protein
MEILNLGGAQENTPSSLKSRKPLRALLAIGAVAAVTGIGSTLAATITLNTATSGAVEFGQGVVTTAACDPEITVTPISAFANSAGTGAFNLQSIELSEIDISGDPAGVCYGKTLTINGYGDTDPSPLFTKTYLVAATSTSIDMSSENPRILAGALFKITIESSDD